MVEVLRAPGHSMDVMGMTSRLSDVKLAPIHETAVLENQRSKDEQERAVQKGPVVRAPRRAFSSNEYRLPTTPTTPRGHPEPRSAMTPAPLRPSEQHDSYFLAAPSTPARTTSPAAPAGLLAPSPAAVSHSAQPPQGLLARPPLPGPQRSYSVMDYEPVPIIQRPGEKLQLIHLAPELHYAIFDFLDPIDSTCLGLTSKHFYSIHWRMHGTVPLAARREGPNDMEWAWRAAGPLLTGPASPAPAGQQAAALAEVKKLAPRGQVYCRKCGISRCELHKHIKEWVPEGLEYCEVSQKFGRKAPDGARKTCYRSSPRHPHRCGRHTRQQRAVRLV